MDSEGSSSSGKRRHAKRREKPGHPPQEKQNHVLEGSGDEEDEASPPRPAPTKGKGKARRQRRSSSASMEDDIIDGFSIRGFITLEDLEVRFSISLRPFRLHTLSHALQPVTTRAKLNTKGGICVN